MSTQLNGTIEILGLDVEDSVVKGMALDAGEGEDPQAALDDWADHMFANPAVTNAVIVRWIDWDDGRSEILAERKR